MRHRMVRLRSTSSELAHRRRAEGSGGQRRDGRLGGVTVGEHRQARCASAGRRLVTQDRRVAVDDLGHDFDVHGSTMRRQRRSFRHVGQRTRRAGGPPDRSARRTARAGVGRAAQVVDRRRVRWGPVQVTVPSRASARAWHHEGSLANSLARTSRRGRRDASSNEVKYPIRVRAPAVPGGAGRGAGPRRARCTWRRSTRRRHPLATCSRRVHVTQERHSRDGH